MLQFGIKKGWDMKNMNEYGKTTWDMKKEKMSFLWRKGIVRNGEVCSFLCTKPAAYKTLPAGATTEGIHNRSFQKHMCSVGDLYFQYLWNRKPRVKSIKVSFELCCLLMTTFTNATMLVSGDDYLTRWDVFLQVMCVLW